MNSWQRIRTRYRALFGKERLDRQMESAIGYKNMKNQQQRMIGKMLSALNLVALCCFVLHGTACRAVAPPGVLGMSVKVGDGWLVITAVHDNFPASQEGLRAGDRITRIDGQSTRDQSLGDCLQRLGGPAGEKIVLTIARGGPEANPFDVTLVRQRRSQPASGSQPVQWKGNKIVSRILPYPDLNSLFIRLPIAHAAGTGKGVKVTVLSLAEDTRVLSLLQEVAPSAEVVARVCPSDDLDEDQIAASLSQGSCRVAVLPDAPRWPRAALLGVVKRLLNENILAVVPSDLSETSEQIETVNQLQALGVLTVGRVDRGSTVMERDETKRQPFNRRIREIHTDVFSTVGIVALGHALDPVATAGGVAALVLEKWPELSPAEVRKRILSGARPAWQGTSIETGQSLEMLIDPITTEYRPKDAAAAFRFRALDAAGALRVDTEIPWFLNMLNCQKAWEITKGRDVVVMVSDQGFHLKHPELTSSIQATKHFGPVTFDHPEQQFHGTEMSRILLAVAPEVRLVPVLCTGTSLAELATNVVRSFRYAAELKPDVVSASWGGYFNTNAALVTAAREIVDRGAVLSWFHYPKAYPGLLRPGLVYGSGEEGSLGFADRFLTGPPGFHPVEIESGLSGTAPQAAGLAALIKSVNPGLTPQRIQELLVRNATPIGSGVLIPDAYRAVLAAGSNATSAPVETTATPLLSPDALREDLDFLFKTVEESHPNVYAHLTKDQYSQAMDEIRGQVAHPMSPSEFYIYVSTALSCIQDTHTRAERPPGFKMPPITESMRAMGNRLGQMLKNNAEPESDTTYVPAPRKEEYTKSFSYHLIPECNACLMVINSFGEPNQVQEYASRFREAFEALKEKKITHLIIDLRENRGGCGFAADELLRYLATKPFRQFETVQQRIVPRFFALCEQWGLNVDSAMAEEYGIGVADMKSKGTYKPGITVTGQVPFKEPHEPSKRFKGQIYLLIGNPTFSTAANFAAAVKWFGIGTLLGQETSGQRDHFGQVLPIQLPQSELQCQVSTAHFVAVGGIQDRGGIKPDREVRQTPEDSSRGIDTALEYALALTRTAAR